MINNDGIADNDTKVTNCKSPSYQTKNDWEKLLDSFSSSLRNSREDAKLKNIEKSCVDVEDESYLVACIMMLTTNRKDCNKVSVTNSREINTSNCNSTVKEAFTESRYAEKLHDFIYRLIAHNCRQQHRLGNVYNNAKERDEELSNMYLRLSIECISIVFVTPSKKRLASDNTDTDESFLLHYWANRHACSLWHVLRDDCSNGYSYEITTLLTILLNYILRYNQLYHSSQHNQQKEEKKSKLSENIEKDDNWMKQFIEWLLTNCHGIINLPDDNREAKIEEEKVKKPSTFVNNSKDNHKNEDLNAFFEDETNFAEDKNVEDKKKLCSLLKSLFLSAPKMESKKGVSDEQDPTVTRKKRKNIRDCLQTCLILQLSMASPSSSSGGKNEYEECNSHSPTLNVAASILQSFYETCRAYFFHHNKNKSDSEEVKEEKKEMWAICIFLLYYTFNPTDFNKDADFTQMESNFIVELCIMGMTWQRSINDDNVDDDENSDNYDNIRQMTIYIMAALIEKFDIQWMFSHQTSNKKTFDQNSCGNSTPLLSKEIATSPMGSVTIFCTLLRLVVGEIRIMLGKLVSENHEEVALITNSSAITSSVLNGIRFSLVGLQALSKLAMQYDDSDDEEADKSTNTFKSINETKIWNEQSIQHTQLSLQDLAHSTKEFILFYSSLQQTAIDDKNSRKYADVEFIAIQCASYLGAFYSQVDLNWPTLGTPTNRAAIPSNFSKNTDTVDNQQDSVEVIITVLAIAVELLTSPKTINASSSGDILSYTNKNSLQYKEKSILCLIPCIISILAQCTDICPNSSYIEEYTNDCNNEKQTYQSLIYNKLLKGTSIMNSIVVQLMTDIRTEVCQQQKPNYFSHDLSKLSWCLILVDTWCQFMVQFPMLHEHEQDKNAMNSCKELLLKGLFPWLETLIRFNSDKNGQDSGAIWRNIHHDCAQTTTMLLDYYIMIVIDNNYTSEFSYIHTLQSKCEHLTANVLR